MKRLSRWLLVAAERFYLYAHGWRASSVYVDGLVPPVSWPFKRLDLYTCGHALNAQKFHDRNS